MAAVKQTLNVGNSLNDGTGETLRSGFSKINTNFTSIYAAGPMEAKVRFANNIISTTVGDIILAPAGNGLVYIDADGFSLGAAYTPASSIGATGDVAGTLAYDDTYLYICTADYDGSTSIWTRFNLDTWEVLDFHEREADTQAMVVL